MATGATIGFGTLFEVSDDGGTTYDPLAEITEITPPAESVDIVDVTHMGSPEATREFIDGLIDAGECTVTLNFIPGSTSDDTIAAMREPQDVRIVFPNGYTWAFTALKSGYEVEAPMDGKMAATLTMKVSGPKTRTAS